MKSFYESHNLWLICDVNRHTSWPAENKLVRYDNTDFVLRGVYREPSREVGTSIVIPLVEKGEMYDKLKILYNFCAALSWFEGRYVNIIRSVVSTSLGVGCDGDITMTGGGIGTINYELLPSNLNDTQKLALTFWKNALSDFDVFYSFLNFYKIIENKFKLNDHIERKAWLKSALKVLIPKNTGITMDCRINIAMEYIKKNIDPQKDIDEEIYTYIYNGSRCAIAHASLDKSVANPDDPRDIEKITMACIIMKALAEQYIKDELHIKNKRCLDIERYQANIQLFKYLQKSKLTL